MGGGGSWSYGRGGRVWSQRFAEGGSLAREGAHEGGHDGGCRVCGAVREAIVSWLLLLLLALSLSFSLALALSQEVN